MVSKETHLKKVSPSGDNLVPQTKPVQSTPRNGKFSFEYVEPLLFLGVTESILSRHIQYVVNTISTINQWKGTDNDSRHLKGRNPVAKPIEFGDLIQLMDFVANWIYDAYFESVVPLERAISNGSKPEYPGEEDKTI